MHPGEREWLSSSRFRAEKAKEASRAEGRLARAHMVVNDDRDELVCS